jgi:DNA-binding MarR family transcriptional regulator
MQLMGIAPLHPSYALHLLFRVFKERRQTIKLANGVLEIYGVSRGQKWRALKELEALGLIRVEHCERKSRRVTVLYPAQDARC